MYSEYNEKNTLIFIRRRPFLSSEKKGVPHQKSRTNFKQV